MTAQRILDSHIHLWPSSAANEKGHSWMKPGEHLTREYSIKDYQSSVDAAKDDNYSLKGFVYLETDRALRDSPALKEWAAGPLDEIAFLRSIVNGNSDYGEGFQSDASRLVKGLVPWVPIAQGVSTFREFISLAEKEAGPETWAKVKGFRYLLQGIKDEAKFRQITDNPETVQILGKFAGKWSFDVGVDQRQGGVWQLEAVADLIEKVAQSFDTIFILNHLCKPDLEQEPVLEHHKQNFERWNAAIERLSRVPKAYMKLSGGFSEIGDQDPANPWPVSTIVERIWPWFNQVLKCFGPNRILFGSDWPVCNVRGPGDQRSWGHWRDVVAELLHRAQLTEAERDRIWFGTAVEAYRLDI